MEEICSQLFQAIHELNNIKCAEAAEKNWTDIMQSGKGNLKSNYKIIWYHLHVKSKKNDTNGLIYKTETYWQRKQIYGYQRGRYGGINEESEINIYTLLYIK